MLVYFDTNIYSYIADTGEEKAVRGFLEANNFQVQASSENLHEIYSIPEPTHLKKELRVITTIASSYEPKPQSWHQAMEVLGEIKVFCSYWLRKPISEELLNQSKKYLSVHLAKWEDAKNLKIPSSSSFTKYKRDLETGVKTGKGFQKSFREKLLSNELVVSISKSNANGKIQNIMSGNISDPDFYWRCSSMLTWFRAIYKRDPSSRDYADWLLPFLKDKAFISPAYPTFWMYHVRANKVNKNRISGLVDFYQLKHKITHGNFGDQMHACSLLDTDMFITADKAYYEVLCDVASHFTLPVNLYFVDRRSESALDEIKRLFSSVERLTCPPKTDPRN